MFTDRSILSLAATSTATQCSAALPTIATTNTPTKNSDSPMSWLASSIEPTRISLIRPTSTAAPASMSTARFGDQWCSSSSACSLYGLKTSLCVRSEKSSPSAYVASRMSATPNEIVSRSEPKCARSSPIFGSPPPWMSWNSAGIVRAAVASRSIADWALAAVWLKVCFSRGRPPTSMEAPITSRMFPITEPTIDAFTTSWRPSIRAKKAMISSGALPNVTFSRPPIPGPVRLAIASVASPMTAAQGITPSAAAEKTSTGDAPARSSTTAAGMKTAR